MKFSSMCFLFSKNELAVINLYYIQRFVEQEVLYLSMLSKRQQVQ